MNKKNEGDPSTMGLLGEFLRRTVISPTELMAIHARRDKALAELPAAILTVSELVSVFENRKAGPLTEAVRVLRDFQHYAKVLMGEMPPSGEGEK